MTNIVLNQYFPKIPNLRGFLPCLIAAFRGHRFFGSMDYTEKPEKPHILSLEWKSGFEEMVRVETGEKILSPHTGWIGKVIHPGSFQAPISGFRIDFPGSPGNGIHTHKKYHLKRLFSKNTQFKRLFTLLNSSVPEASFFHP